MCIKADQTHEQLHGAGAIALGKVCLYTLWIASFWDELEPLSVLQEGQKAIYHLEAFVAKFMSEYKSWSIAVLG